MARALVLVAALAALAALTLTACATEPAPPPAAAPTEAAPSVEPTVAPLVFTLPTDCATILPQSRLDAFADLGLVLLGGPGGKYGTEYLADQTPEEQLGGITCIWGFDASDLSSVTVSVAPLTADTRAQALDGFATQGLEEVLTESTASYNQTGDAEEMPAITNVLRDDSWISVIKTVGGDPEFDEAVAIAGEAASAAYN